jgi:tetratricopeptide (TPR) repeat protein
VALRKIAAEIVDIGRQLHDERLLYHGLWELAHPAMRLGDLETADRCIDEFEAIDRRTGTPVWQWLHLSFKTTRALLAADLPRAEHVIEEMREFEQQSGGHTGGVPATATFLLRREQGRLGGLTPAVRAIVAHNPSAALWGPGLAALYAELGLIGDARAELERLAVEDFAALRHDANWDQCLALLAEVAAAVGDSPCAARLFDELLPAQAQLLVIWGTGNCLGPADRLLGMLASTAGRVDEAEEWFERATAFSRRLPSPLWVAHCLYDHAIHRSGTGRDGAGPMLAEAAELCQHYGLAGLGQKVEQASGYPYAVGIDHDPQR